MAEANAAPTITLESLVALWPIAACLSSHLPTDDLFALARLSTGLRAAWHGFGLPEGLDDHAGTEMVRESINIGLHGTPYWKSLKDVSQHTCSSSTHTRGDKVHGCRLCSRLICEACIVRSSFSRGKEDTFRNRCRFFCEECWNKSNVSKTRKYPLSTYQQVSSPDDPGLDVHEDPFCNCTLKKNGWLCLECKDAQNYEATSNDRLKCYGLGCVNMVGADHERRRICLWCDKVLPGHLGSASRQVWNQKIIEARTRNALSRQADMEEYNRKRLKMMRMSRRELRGDAAVVNDPDADVPQYVRHLDSCANYRNFMNENSAPDGDTVYASKRGYWRYHRLFLIQVGRRCRMSKLLRSYQYLRTATCGNSTIFARSNLQLDREQSYCTVSSEYDDNGNITCIGAEQLKLPLSHSRAIRWLLLKTRVLDMAFIQRLDYSQLQTAIQVQYAFNLPWSEFRTMLNIFGLTPLWEGTEFDHVRQHPHMPIEEASTSIKEHFAEAKPIFERDAARIIESLVQHGYTLPLRSLAEIPTPTIPDYASSQTALHGPTSPEADQRPDLYDGGGTRPRPPPLPSRAPPGATGWSLPTFTTKNREALAGEKEEHEDSDNDNDDDDDNDEDNDPQC